MILKVQISFVILMLHLFCINASMMLANFKNPAYPGKCYVDGKVILSPGEKVKSSVGCGEIRCSNADGMGDIVGCISIAPPPNCEWDGYENVDDPYPLCCVQRYNCQDPDDEPQAKIFQQNLRDMLKDQMKSKE